MLAESNIALTKCEMTELNGREGGGTEFNTTHNITRKLPSPIKALTEHVP